MTREASLTGVKVLVVEDDYFLAVDIARAAIPLDVLATRLAPRSDHDGEDDPDAAHDTSIPGRMMQLPWRSPSTLRLSCVTARIARPRSPTRGRAPRR